MHQFKHEAEAICHFNLVIIQHELAAKVAELEEFDAD